MDIKESRVGVYFPPTTSLWAGTVTSYDSDTFILTVGTTTGALADLSAGLAVTHSTGVARIRDVNPGAGTITLAENPIEYVATDVITAYNARLPFPRYQRVTSTGVVYKDWDIAWPGQYAAMPPTACIYPEAIVTTSTTSVALVATLSAAMAVGATIASYTWDAGTGGVITGSGSSVSVAYSTAGFRYLSLTVLDSLGASTVRYIPVWIDQDAETSLESCSLSWKAGSGWSAQLALAIRPGYIERTPLVVVDLETEEILFFGFIHPQQVSYDFERDVLSFTALSPLAYMTLLYSYPFVLESVAVGVASTWHEVYSCTLQRAAWVLLYWHSTLPEICDVTFPAAARAIAGQEFSAGTLRTQLSTVLKAAFWQARGWRSGGLGLTTDPLYSPTFGSLSALTLTDADVEGRIEYERTISDISEARLSGVYYDSGWEPLIVRSPAHPWDLGRPGEVTALAPQDAAELRFWAGRYMAIATTSDYRLTALVDVDPSVKYRLILPDTTQLAIESITLSHDAGGLRWGEQVGGRPYGDDVDTIDEDPPPEIVIPPPVSPPPSPPATPMPPGPLPETIWFGTEDFGVYRSDDFTEPDDVTQPTWALDNVGLPDVYGDSDITLVELTYDPYEPLNQAALINDASLANDEGPRSIYVRLASDDPYEWSLSHEGDDFLSTCVTKPLYIWHIRYDPTGSGKLWAISSPKNFYVSPASPVPPECLNDDPSPRKLGDIEIYVEYSIGHGAWSNTTTEIPSGLVVVGVAGFDVYGDRICFYAGRNFGGWYFYTAGGPGDFDNTYLADYEEYADIFGENIRVFPNGDMVYVYTSNDLMKLDLGSLQCEDPLQVFMINDNLNGIDYDRTNSLHQKSVRKTSSLAYRETQMFITNTAWGSLVSASPTIWSGDIRRMWTPIPGDSEEEYIFFGQIPKAGRNDHILLSKTEADIPVGKSGDNPGTSPFTDSIPNTAGDPCDGALIVGAI